MTRKRSSSAIDILAAAAAADNQSRHASDDEDERNKLSGSDPEKAIEATRKSSRKPKRRRLDEWSKNGNSGRLWSEQDEIGILQGMIDFRFRKGEDPYSDMNAFHEFVQDLISVRVSKKQLTGKIRKLKAKYLAYARRPNVGTVKARDDRLFVLSKMIWVDNGGNGNLDVVHNGVEDHDDEDGNVDVADNGVEVEDEGNMLQNRVNGMLDVAESGDEEAQNMVQNGVNRKVDVVKNGVEVEECGNMVQNGVNGKVDVAKNGVEVSHDKEDEGKDFKKMYPYLSTGWESDVSCSPLLKNYLMDNINLVEGVKLREMDKNWKNLYEDELKLYVRKLELAKERAQAVLDQLATSDS